MKIIVNKFIPFHGYLAMAFYNKILWRKEYEWYLNTLRKDYIINHESIHEAQMRDFCKWILVGGTIFYILYVLEWIYRFFFSKDIFSKKAYKNLTFEKEANTYEKDLNYLKTRKKFNQYAKIILTRR